MKVYLDDEKTHVDPCPHNGHSVGWTVMTETIVVGQWYIFYCAVIQTGFLQEVLVQQLWLRLL